MEDRLDFGKHKGKKLQEVSLDYILFLAGFKLEGTRKTKLGHSASNWITINRPHIRVLAIEYLRDRCWNCGGKLIPIGTSRQNGTRHHDWEERILHKKCWKQLLLHENN